MIHAAGDLLRPYLSGWLHARIAARLLRPGHLHSGAATVLYADLSGFTRLAAAFAPLPDGAERLHDALSRPFDALIATVFAFGGDVAAIAGDALTAWWPDTAEPALGRRCGAAMLAALEALPPIATPEGPFRPGLRIGVSAGPVYAAIAGLPSQGLHLVVFGPALASASAAERTAATDSVSVLAPAADTAPPRPPAPRAAGPPLDYEEFLPPAFVERLRLNALVPEYRRCVPAFCAFTLPRRPEQLHRLVAQVQAVVTRWGGWLNEVEVGDKGAVFVLLFGAPVARGDDPNRAVGCCLELRDRGLIAKAGVTLGLLFVGPVGNAQRRVYTAQGDDMNLAAHLMERAAPGQILVTGRVREEIAGRYRTSPPALIATKGHAEGVPVSEVAARDGLAGRGVPRRFLQNGPALVGRALERRALEELAAAAIGGRPRLAVVVGESGIGKSSLVHALVGRWAERGLRVLAGEWLSGAAGEPLGAWRTVLLDLCAIDEGAPPREQRARLARAARGLPEARAGTAPLAQLLRVGFGHTQRRPDPASLAPALALALALLRRTLAAGPLLIALEDAHWAEPPALQLVVELLGAAHAAKAPLLLVCTTRPVEGGRPDGLAALAAQPGAVRLTLAPLSDAEGLALTRTLLGVRHLQPALAQHIQRHSAGQPLFIREYLRAMRQQGLIEVEDDSARLSQRRAATQLSAATQGIIQARVDRLDEPARLTLKVAAVIGRSFPLRLLAAVHPAGVDEATLRRQLATLARLQIVDLELDDPERVYRFKHGVTHEVAYGSLLFGQRRAIHAAAADWYAAEYAAEVAAGGASLAIYDVLIDHLRRSERWAEAVAHCRQAAAQAFRAAAHAAALRYVDQALVLRASQDERRALLLLRLAINDRVGTFSAHADDLAALDVLSPADALLGPAALAAVLRARFFVAVAQPGAVLGLAPATERLLRRTSRERLPGARLLRAAWLNAWGAARSALGEPEAGRALQRRALALCDAGKEPAAGVEVAGVPVEAAALAARCLGELGEAALADGRRGAALALFQRARALAKAGGDWCGEAEARARAAGALRRLGREEAARAELDTALATCQAVGDHGGQALALRELASLSAQRGDYAEAQRRAWHALAICGRAQARALELRLLADLADYATALGQEEEAEAARQEIRRLRTAPQGR